jgi:hypothetical protein
VTVAALSESLAAGIAVALGLAGWRAGTRPVAIVRDLAGWTLLAGLTFWLYAPYRGGGLVGAGDAYHYSLQVADYVTQVRSGHFPVFVGQTEYGFNGNIHTLRTAPYFLHFTGMVDLLTGRRLTFAELLDLTVLLHALGAAFCAWRVARSILGKANQNYAVGLAALYALSPAIVGTVQAFDLVATFMALPWLPLFLGAIVRLLESDIWKGMITGTWALAIIWWAHPAIGLWGTGLWTLSWLVVLGRRRERARWRAALLSGAGLAAMTTYCFVSVHSLHLGYDLGQAAEVRAEIVAAVRPLWPGFIFHSLGDPAKTLRPGYPLWIFGLLPLVIFPVRSDARRLIIFGMALLLLLLGLIPLWTTPLWHLVPNAILQITNTAIVSRSPAMLAVLLLTSAALGLRSLAGLSRGRRRAVGWALAVAVGWSLQAAGPVRQAATVSTWTPADTNASLDPRNVTLTRSSYALFGRFPRYFTNGRTAAPWEVRLLDTQTQRVTVTNAGAVVAAARALGTVPPWLSVGDRPRPLPTRPDRGYVLEFAFSPGTSAGEIQLRGQALFRNYTLPSSGREGAFGSAPGNSRLIGFMPGEHDGAAIVARGLRPGASVRVYPFAADSLPLQVESLLPLRTRIEAKEPALFESPRVWVPGYRATLDGSDVPVLVSPEGFAMMGVPAGVHQSEITYVPPRTLRGAYDLSLFTLAGWTGLVLFGGGSRPEKHPGRTRRRQKWLAGSWAGLMVVVACLAGGEAFLHRSPRYGAVHLAIRLPREVPASAEPLLVTGRAGSAEVLYVRYRSDQLLEVGCDQWGVGGPVSAPIAYKPGQVVTVDIAYATLFAGHAGNTPPRFRDPAHGAVVVRWNGQPALDFVSRVQGEGGSDPALGVNAIGASSCSTHFSGEILEASRLGPADLPGK